MNKKWHWIIFPALTILLGWGLRGYIGGGPFGAMIPGAFVALSIALLLNLSVEATSVLVVFAAVGIGLGGEMTYGQTLGFLRNSETVLWGSLGTTLKGSIWGLLGGIFITLGLFYKQLQRKTIVFGIVSMLLAMYLGFKLINQPMLIYFSDRVKPRAESWAALLFGAITLFIYLKVKVSENNFRIVKRFALWGFIGGGLGFGLGSQWMTIGNFLPEELIFQNWWKAMEFSFGLLLGGGIGLAAWQSRMEIKELKALDSDKTTFDFAPIWKDVTVVTLMIFFIFWLMPGWLDSYVDQNYEQGRFLWPGLVDIAKMLTNFAFYGFLMIVVVLWFPKFSWQVGITLTFCYTAIDLMQDIYPDYAEESIISAYLALIVILNLFVGLPVAWLQRKNNIIRNMFLLILWSCMVVAFLRLGLEISNYNTGVNSVMHWIFGRYFVHIVFVLSAILITCFAVRINRIQSLSA